MAGVELSPVWLVRNGLVEKRSEFGALVDSRAGNCREVEMVLPWGTRHKRFGSDNICGSLWEGHGCGGPDLGCRGLYSGCWGVVEMLALVDDEAARGGVSFSFIKRALVALELQARHRWKCV